MVKKFIGIQWFLVKTLSQSAEKGVQLQLIKEIQVSCQMTHMVKIRCVFVRNTSLWRHYDLFRDEKSV